MSPSQSPVIVWFRQDLRLSDNPALMAAAASGQPIIALYILDDHTADRWAMGGASRWWLHHSLQALNTALQAHGGALVLKRGPAQAQLEALITETGADAVFWNRCYEPWRRTRDEQIKSTLTTRGIKARSFKGALIVEPWDIATKTGAPYRVFTPFWKALQAKHTPEAPLAAPQNLQFADGVGGDELDAWRLTPSAPDWAGGLRHAWTPGEDGADQRLARFVKYVARGYDDQRNLPGKTGTSGLSPHLHFGEISPRQVWDAVQSAGLSGTEGGHTFLSEIAWREFSYNLLYHFPTLPEQNFQPRFNNFTWEDDPAGLVAWQKGQTGFPIVDAGMRQLWKTGWMHNRVRMIVASFLIKDLRVDWRHGQDWFWDTLVDADLASNAASWQWVAGSGADAAPYFRVFNPTGQGEKFDPDGAYVRTWLPELSKLPAKGLHAPWTLDRQTLRDCGVKLGDTYPAPIVDHAEARLRALAEFEKIKDAS